MMCFSAWESAGVDFIANDYHLEDVYALVSDLIVEVKPCPAAAARPHAPIARALIIRSPSPISSPFLSQVVAARRGMSGHSPEEAFSE